MKSLLLLSVLIAIIAIPIRAAAIPNPRRALRKLAVNLILFTVFYMFALRFVYPRLL